MSSPHPARTSTAAIVSLGAAIVSALGGCLLCGLPPLVAVIAGHVGIARTRNGRLRGHGVALTGTLIGYLMVVLVLLVGALVVGGAITQAQVSEFFKGPAD